MVLSGTKQEVQENYSELGVVNSYQSAHIHEIIQYFVELAKGRDYSDTSDWFYYIFLDLPYSVSDIPDNISDIRLALQDAWWVEEEDLHQVIMLVLFRYRYLAPMKLSRMVACTVRNYLLKQKVFTPVSSISDDYNCLYSTTCEPGPNFDVNFFLDEKNMWLSSKLSRFERFLAYHYWYLGLSQDEVSDIVREHPRQFMRWMAKLKLRMEDIYGTKSASREVS